MVDVPLYVHMLLVLYGPAYIAPLIMPGRTCDPVLALLLMSTANQDMFFCQSHDLVKSNCRRKGSRCRQSVVVGTIYLRYQLVRRNIDVNASVRTLHSL